MSSYCWAHGFAGKRFFPTTFVVDDPFIGDEFSLLISYIKNAGDAKSTEINIDYSKRIVPNLGLQFHDAYQHLSTKGDGTANGWENFSVGAKWQFFTSDEHETILSIGADIEIGGTGARQVSDSFSNITPAFYFGKGFGDLPDSLSLLKPFAVTGVLGVNFPTSSSTFSVDQDTGEPFITRNSVVFNWGFTLQYSLQYLQAFVRDIGLGAPLNRMILVVEFPMQTNLSRDDKGKTTGTVNPGLVWVGKFMELGVAAQIPINSRSGRNVGILGLIHFFVDDIFPKSIGAPLFP